MTVIRDGISSEMQANQLVVGDVIEFVGGDRIPADIRVIQSKYFKINLVLNFSYRQQL